ncbi:MAG: ABC transporter ATP-binding protein/permease [Alicyclobacillus macrosporangiidus]|uniref:ABC transporter ATP-binding protein n=1 Tax=Alicyclobacillus macrosporangiidus TaxID=392015 RepID=UPI0026EC965F|nr:ABC transporter ATP-binding protein [Alicyclobacillus macrosporangiidus]MCL6597680.1 ABC transporter ATP-binding protein/permease [Alicyclobacillus macrosporangiidus]
MTVWRRLGAYAWSHRRVLVAALAMLSVAVVSELSGPFIAKRMIDVHISGIEQPWYEVSGPAPQAVLYQNHWYARADEWPAGAPHGGEVRILQVGRAFYFVPQAISSDGERSVADGRIRVQRQGQVEEAPAVRLSAAEVFAFYRPEVPALWRLALVYLGLLAVSAVFTYGHQLLLQVMAGRVLQQLRRDVFAHIHRLPMRFFDTTPAGRVVSRVTNDTETIRDLFVTVLANVGSSAVYLAGIYTALFLLDVRMALICLLLLPLLAGWMVLYRRMAGVINHRIRALVGEVNAMINETIQGISVIRAFHRERRTLAEFDAINGELFRQQTRLLRINSATGWNLAGTLRNLFFAALIAYFGWRTVHRASLISFGALYAFIDYLTRLFQPVTQVVNQLANLEQARVSAERVFALLDEPEEDGVSGELPRVRGHVVFEDVYFSYDGRRDVLKGISFEALPGQTVALVGHTGSGKSSVMNLLFRFYEPRAGRIRIDGRDLCTMPRQALRRQMAIVLQDPFLFTGTIASNVSLGNPHISRAQVDEALRAVGADRLLGHLSKGWDEPVHERGSTLSLGQRQLISFARALACQPAILVLDEATANIDSESEAVIQEALEVLKRGRTTFVIAHRLSTIRNADLILVLHQGRIVERGTHDELMALRGRYFRMVQTQTGMGAPAAD